MEDKDPAVNPESIQPWEVKEDRSLFNNSISPNTSYSFEKPQVGQEATGSVWGAAWRAGGTGSLAEIIMRSFIPKADDPSYNVYKDVPDRYLNEIDIGSYARAMSTPEADSVTASLDNWYKDNATREAQPWATFGASIVADPLMMLVPTLRVGKTAKAAYTSAVAAKGVALTPQIFKGVGSGMVSGSLNATAQAIATEALVQQVQANKTLAESFFDVGASGVLGAVVGGAGGGIASALGYRSAKSHIVNALADIPDTPGMQPNTKLFLMGPLNTVISDSNEQIAAIPKWVRNGMKYSDMNHMMESPYQTTNATANLLYTHSYIVSKNVTEDLPTTKSLDDLIFARQRQSQRVMIDVDRAFREQLGIKGGFAEGIRARVAEPFTNQFNLKQFNEGIFQKMETGLDSPNPQVNKSVNIIRNGILNPYKQELVNIDMLHPKFLDPKYDNYYYRMWQQNRISKMPNEFKELTYRFFKDTDKFYRDNQQKISNLNAKPTATRAEVKNLQESVEKYLTSGEYSRWKNTKKDALKKIKEDKTAIRESIKVVKKDLKEAKKAKNTKTVKDIEKKIKDMETDLAKLETKRKQRLSKRPQKLERMVSDIDRLKKRAIVEMNDLIDFIPPEYMPHDGHIPSPKTDAELLAAADRTLMRLLGTDLESVMNPFARGLGGADPLEARVFGMPSTYSAEIISSDGVLRTVTASDFIEKDIQKVMGNYIRRTAGVIETEKMAKGFGFDDSVSFKRFLQESLKADYDFAIKGKIGKKADKLTKQFEADQERISRSFDTLNGITGNGTSEYGGKWPKFSSFMRQWNEVSKLGSAALSSTTDLAMAPFRQGFESTLKDWLVPFLQKVVTLQTNKALRMNKIDAADMGFAMEVELGKRIHAIRTNSDLNFGNSFWGNVFDKTTDALKKTGETIKSPFGNISTLSHIGDLSQNTGFHMSVSRSMRIIDKFVKKGKLSERDRIRMRSLEISNDDMKLINEMWRESVGPDGGKSLTSYYSDMGKWKVNTPERAEAYNNFKIGTIRDTRASFLQSTAGNRPKGYYNMWLRPMLQFKDYLLAANEKVFMSGLQKLGLREFDVFLTTMNMMAMGAFAYVLNGLAKDPSGKNLDLSAKNLFLESVDRAALLGIIAEPINLFQKAGWIPGGERSRWQSRGIIGGLLGPSAGMLEDIAYFVGDLRKSATGERRISAKDATRLLRLLPYQNLYYLRYINEQVAKNLAVKLGAKRG